MVKRLGIVLLPLLTFFPFLSIADDVSYVRESVKRSTLNQPGTRPFHLVASFASSRGTNPSRTGEVEIWWQSPDRYRKELRTPEFHQIEIVNGDRVWQKNDGTYRPEWLRELTVALIDPVPHLEDRLKDVAGADLKHLAGSTYYQWSVPSTDGQVTKGIGSSIAISDATGLLFYGGGPGWCGLYRDYKKFHDLHVARTVLCGSPEVTAKITDLGDLKLDDKMFDASAPGADPHPIKTILLDEVLCRKNLESAPPIAWPTIQDGPFEGTLTATVAIDREGIVREIGAIVTDNHAVSETASKAISAMRFKPVLVNGEPVQVVSRITMSFKAGRLAGTENFLPAKTYLASLRAAEFLGNASKSPYTLKAEFDAADPSGKVEKGDYEDTWIDAEHWKREAHFGSSRYVRSQDGGKRYQLEEGRSVGLLRVVFKFLEPVADLETTYEADWKVRPADLNGANVIRLHAGYIKDDGSFDQNVRAYWIAPDGTLLKVHWKGLDAIYSNPQKFQSASLARSISVFNGNSLSLKIRIIDVSPAPDGVSEFKLKGHEWQHAFTDEER